MITPRLINHKAYTPALLLTRKMLVSVGAMREETSWLYQLNSVSRVSHVSVKQRTLQSLMSLWNATLARISSTLLSRDWTLASSMLGSGARCAHLRSLTRRPLRLPLRGLIEGFQTLAERHDQALNTLLEQFLPRNALRVSEHCRLTSSRVYATRQS